MSRPRKSSRASITHVVAKLGCQLSRCESASGGGEGRISHLNGATDSHDPDSRPRAQELNG